MKKSVKKSVAKSVNESLFFKTESAWDKLNKKKVFDFSDDYKSFLDSAKTEREAVLEIEKRAKKHGFSEFKRNLKSKKFFIKTNKTIALIKVGSFDSIKVVASHIDSPRLDLKPNPLFEDSDLCLLKSHYYGGIKKYQWVNRPLAIHGVVITKSSRVFVRIGDSSSDPVFVISDLLPHLAKHQYEKKVSEFISGEDLNIVVGNIPFDDKKISEKFKLNVLKILNKKYGITERDFVSAELEIVPAESARDVGFDRSLVGSYAHDDHVCAYTSMQALFDSKNKQTVIALFVDKEEIGSEGKSSAQSVFFVNVLSELIRAFKIKKSVNELLLDAEIISADVTSGINPNFKDAQDVSNASVLGRGVSIEKYGGGGGKYMTNDADAEYVSRLIKLFDSKKVPWQTGENGKIDLGGGGTIAMYFSKLGADVIDIGPPVLGMHSPFELVSKADVFSAFLAYKVFYEQ